MAIWGLVYLIGSLVGIEPGGDPSVPTLPGTGIVLGGAPSKLTLIILQFHLWISYIVYFLIGLTLLFFLWGVAKYILSGGDSENKLCQRYIQKGFAWLFHHLVRVALYIYDRAGVFLGLYERWWLFS